MIEEDIEGQKNSGVTQTWNRNISYSRRMSTQPYTYISCCFFSPLFQSVCVLFFLPHTPLRNDWQCLVDFLRLQGPGLWKNKVDAGCRIPLWFLNLEAAWKLTCSHELGNLGITSPLRARQTGPVAMENEAKMDEVKALLWENKRLILMARHHSGRFLSPLPTWFLELSSSLSLFLSLFLPLTSPVLWDQFRGSVIALKLL